MREPSTTEESDTTLGPRSKIRVELVIAIVAGFSWIGWVTSELNTVKSLVSAKNDSVASVQSEVRNVQADVRIMAAQIKQFEDNGSKPMQALQKSLDSLQFKLDSHMNIQPKVGP